MLRTPEIVQLGNYFEDGYFKDHIYFEPYLFGR